MIISHKNKFIFLKPRKKEITSLNGLYDIFSSINAKGGIRDKKSLDLSIFYKEFLDIEDYVYNASKFEIEKFNYIKPSLR